jgi:hypothetical protein
MSQWIRRHMKWIGLAVLAILLIPLALQVISWF